MAAHLVRWSEHYTEQHQHVPRYPWEPWEQIPIGLLICQSAAAEEVRYALGELEQRIFVARYQVRLPKEQEIATFLREHRPS
jgi:hypothetical protein